MNPLVGIVVPTLGNRPDYLSLSLKSIRKAGPAWILLVAPKSLDVSELFQEKLIDEFIFDSGEGLASAINDGIRSLPDSVKYVNWLGDDDLLEAGSIDLLKSLLDEQAKTVAVFGSCSYIDSRGKEIFYNRSGQWAVPLLRFGPDLIPQPGALFRRTAFNFVGGLDSRYYFAFDLDLFLKLSKIGKLLHVKSKLASFRWHPDSLTVEFRENSVREASIVRKSHLPLAMSRISKIWEQPVKKITFRAGLRLSRVAKSRDMIE